MHYTQRREAASIMTHYPRLAKEQGLYYMMAHVHIHVHTCIVDRSFSSATHGAAAAAANSSEVSHSKGPLAACAPKAVPFLTCIAGLDTLWAAQCCQRSNIANSCVAWA
jgi:hypothetical protein